MMTGPRPSDVRYRVEPGDVPPEKAARRLHLTLGQFKKILPRLLERGFPAADVTTEMFDLDAIASWLQAKRHGLAGEPDSWAAQLAVDHDQEYDRIYVVGFSSFVKIGHTRWPIRYRLSRIQTSCPEKLHVYGAFRAPRQTEKDLHRRFAAQRTHGEWFRREGDLADWINDGCLFEGVSESA